MNQSKMIQRFIIVVISFYTAVILPGIYMNAVPPLTDAFRNIVDTYLQAANSMIKRYDMCNFH